tara:strand:+ start:6917 stop:7750 length:834 start_codon:yes stop_codon:yes gene_type:complete
MNILSIDVGMKNLAICLFNITDELNYKIKLWDVINLCNEKDFYCGEINNKTKKICNKKAKFTKNNKYYCKIHAKNKDFKIPPPELNLKKIKKLKILKLKELAKKYDIEVEKKIKKDELQKIMYKKVETEYFDNISSIKTKDFNLVQYGRNLKKEFNKIFENIQIDGVIIENQIGPLAMRMKTLQGMIMQHFIEKNIPLVEEVSASNKLKEFLGNKKTTYSERKKESIIITRNILNENNYLNKWLEVFDKHKKKDDLADSFLQGRWYLKNTILKEKIE